MGSGASAAERGKPWGLLRNSKLAAQVDDYDGWALEALAAAQVDDYDRLLGLLDGLGTPKSIAAEDVKRGLEKLLDSAAAQG